MMRWIPPSITLLCLLAISVSTALARDASRPATYRLKEKAWGGSWPWSAPKNPFKARGQDSCPTVKVDTAPFGHTRFQGKMGVCYAYATSDLLSHCLKQGQISALDLAENYAFDKYPKSSPAEFLNGLNSGGHPWEAIDAIIKRKSGVCPEKVMPSDAQSYRIASNLPLLSPLEQFNEGTFEHIRKILKLREEFDATGTLSCANINTNHGCFPHLGITTPQIFGDFAMLKIIEQTTASEFLERIDSLRCDKHRVSITACLPMNAYTAPVASTGPKDVKIMAGHTLFPELDMQLAKGNPVEIATYKNFLYSPGGAETGGSTHAMVVIGRHYRKGDRKNPASGCVYRIRNSWGTDCEQYKKSRFVLDCDPATGYFSVLESTLDKNLTSINYFTRGKDWE